METALLKNMVKKNRWFSSWLLAVKAIYKTGHHVTFVILSHLLCLLPKDTAPFSFASYSVYSQFVCVFSVSLPSIAFSSSPCISRWVYCKATSIHVLLPKDQVLCYLVEEKWVLQNILLQQGFFIFKNWIFLWFCQRTIRSEKSCVELWVVSYIPGL